MLKFTKSKSLPQGPTARKGSQQNTNPGGPTSQPPGPWQVHGAQMCSHRGHGDSQAADGITTVSSFSLCICVFHLNKQTTRPTRGESSIIMVIL